MLNISTNKLTMTVSTLFTFLFGVHAALFFLALTKNTKIQDKYAFRSSITESVWKPWPKKSQTQWMCYSWMELISPLFTVDPPESLWGASLGPPSQKRSDNSHQSNNPRLYTHRPFLHWTVDMIFRSTLFLLEVTCHFLLESLHPVQLNPE